MISMIRGSGVPGSIKPPRSLSSQTLSTHYPIPFRAVMFLSRPSAYGGLKLNVMMDSYPPATVPFGISHSKYLSELYKKYININYDRFTYGCWWYNFKVSSLLKLNIFKSAVTNANLSLSVLNLFKRNHNIFHIFVSSKFKEHSFLFSLS